MLHRRIARMAALFALVTGCGAASAADVTPYVSPMKTLLTPQPMSVDGPSGWYLRGDIGYRINPAPSGSIPGVGNITSASMRGAITGGIGAGYQVNEFLRLDATLDGTPTTQYSGVVSTTESTKISAINLMANAYVDLGTYQGFTPYVGAGIGAADLTTSAAMSNGSTQRAGGASRWNFAYALMAGTSYRINSSLALDLGYRYIHEGRAQSADTGSGAVTYDNVRAHEIRMGLRYSLN